MNKFKKYATWLLPTVCAFIILILQLEALEGILEIIAVPFILLFVNIIIWPVAIPIIWARHKENDLKEELSPMDALYVFTSLMVGDIIIFLFSGEGELLLLYFFSIIANFISAGVVLIIGIKNPKKKKIKKPSKKVVITISIVVVVTILIIGKPISQHIWTNSLNAAIEKRDNKKVEKMVKNNTFYDINKEGRLLSSYFITDAPLSQAIYVGNYEAAKILVENGAKLANEDEFGYGILDYALSIKTENHYEIIKIIVENGGYPKEEGEEPILLQAAALGEDGEGDNKEYLNIYKLLEKYSTETRPLDPYEKKDSLMIAAGAANDYLVEYLIKDKKYDVNRKDLNGETPLFHATSYIPEEVEKEMRENQPKTVKILLKYGADKNIKDKNGRTAYDYLVQGNGSKELQALLKPDK